MPDEPIKSRVLIQIAFASISDGQQTAFYARLRTVLKEYPPSTVHTRKMDSFGVPETPKPE